MSIPFTLTNTTATVVIDGASTTVREGQTNFAALRAALVEGLWDKVPSLLTPGSAFEEYLRSFSWKAENPGTYSTAVLDENGKVVDKTLVSRAQEMCRKGEDPTGLFNFWLRLRQNPSMRSVEQLFEFINRENIPFEKDGHFLAYKGVTTDLKDCHTRTFDNSPGQIHEMPRNEISDDPRQGCHVGFHVGSKDYARNFGQRCMIVRVDPAYVVCVPYDHSYQKVRTCKYEVVGFDTSDEVEDPGMPNTTYEVDVEESETDREVREADEAVEGCDDLDCDCENGDEEVAAPSAPNLDNARDAKSLLAHGIGDLRTYASKVLKIVGASKIPGGKTALVKRILKVRSRNA